MLLSRQNIKYSDHHQCAQSVNNIMLNTTSSSSPHTLAHNVLDKILDKITVIREETDSGKDSSSISDSIKNDDDSERGQSDLDEDVENSDEVGDVCFMENWKMERQFDKAIEGLRKLKEEPVNLTRETSRKLVNNEETTSDENETFVISPFSENQTYTIKVMNNREGT